MTEETKKTNTETKEEKKVVETPKKESLPTDKKLTSKTNKSESVPKKATKIISNKTEAVVNVKSLPISTKQAVDLCRFIKGKKIDDAVNYLEQVAKGKRALPMRGELPHRKDKITGITSGRGRYPKNSTEHFIKLLKNLKANANVNGIDDQSKIFIASASPASAPYGRGGRHKKKRTNVTIKMIDKSKLKGKKN